MEYRRYSLVLIVFLKLSGTCFSMYYEEDQSELDLLLFGEPQISLIPQSQTPQNLDATSDQHYDWQLFLSEPDYAPQNQSSPKPIIETETKNDTDSSNEQSLDEDGLHQCCWKDCWKTFVFSNNFYDHVNQAHVENNKSFKCHWILEGGALCGKKLVNKKNFKEHLTIHSDKKPFACKTCSKTFRRKDYLLNHEVRAHAAKNFLCDRCNRSFQNIYFLKKHLIVGDNCAEDYDEENLSLLYCSQCPKGFKSRSTLNFHIKTIHDNPKAFKCETCSLCFSQKAHLKRHKSTIHPSSVKFCQRIERKLYELRIKFFFNTGANWIFNLVFLDDL